jgi:hypothetical protein
MMVVGIHMPCFAHLLTAQIQIGGQAETQLCNVQLPLFVVLLHTSIRLSTAALLNSSLQKARTLCQAQKWMASLLFCAAAR